MAENHSEEDSEPNRPRARGIPMWGRLVLAGGLTLGLVWYLDPELIAARILDADPVLVAAACCILMLQYALGALRWHLVLRRHDIDHPALQLQAIYGAGALANLTGLTMVAGMSVRGLLLHRRRTAVSRIFGVLFVERFCALAGFGLCFLVGLMVALPRLRHGLIALDPPAFVLPLAGTVLALLAVACLLLGRLRFVRDLLAEVRNSFLSVRAITILAILSCVIVWLGFGAVAILSRGMALKVDPVFFLVIMPVIAFLAALPVTLGGWGVREGSMVAGLLLFGVPADAGAALSITYGALGTGVTLLLGGVSALLLTRRNAERDTEARDGMT